ncbi:MAG: hypothetical protein Q8733_01305 [Pigeon pea little leaf phytoplasma]|nr:hypothetical protein [Pigeon pea little leaf phytoplasma]
MKKEYIIKTSSLNKIIIILVLIIVIIILMFFLLFEDTRFEITTPKNITKSSYINENPRNLKKHIGIDDTKKQLLNHSANVSSGNVLNIKRNSLRP